MGAGVQAPDEANAVEGDDTLCHVVIQYEGCVGVFGLILPLLPLVLIWDEWHPKRVCAGLC